MKNISPSFGVACVVIASTVFIAGESHAAAVYNINKFTHFNGVDTFTDSFEDGIEPTGFASDRESGGALTLNTDDGIVIANTRMIGAGLFDLIKTGLASQFSFAPGLIQLGNPGFISGEFDASFGFTNNSGFGIEVGVNPQTSAYASITVDDMGRIFAGWGNDPNTRFNENDRFKQDITSELGLQTLITLTITVDSNNMASAFFDFGSDSVDNLIIRDFTTMDLAPLQVLGGTNYISGGFGAFEPVVVPVPAAFWLFGSSLLGLIGLAKRKKG